MSKKVLFVGAGNMGGAILQAAAKSGVLDLQSTFVIDSDQQKAQAFAEQLGIRSENPGDADIVVLAVKPQALESVFPLSTAPDALLISVLAGTTTDKLAKVSKCTRICRVMPNTPVLVSAGMSALYFTTEVETAARAFVINLFAACGEAIEIEDEDMMHAITALSGSGPAYFFYLVELMIAAGENMGIPKEVARILAKNTFHGASKLMQKTGERPEVLRKNVTSPGGTTEAALGAFADARLAAIVQKALEAAAERSRELGR